MPMLELSHTPRPKILTRALLIYESPDGDLITDHPIKGGVIQPGKPLNLRSLKALLDSPDKKDGKVASNVISWRFPRIIGETQDWHLWWSPAGVRSIFIADKPAKAWFPTLIFASHRSLRSLFCWATPNAEPTPQCDVYLPVFSHHIFANGAVCLGSTQATGNDPDQWESGFFGSNFMDNINLSPTPYDITTTFKKIGPLEYAASSIPTRRQLAD